MYSIEKKDFGFYLTFTGYIDDPEMKRWAEESHSNLQSVSSPFGVFVDMRNLKPLPDTSQKFMQDGQKEYKAKGMERSAVVVANAVTKMQFKRIAQETGIYDWERYIDEQSAPDWEKKAMDWIKDGIDPDA